ncbi:MAG: DUF6198 family protein [Lachnospiraceae bacterium]|nr:DUF6198 family protein [Lachnospiraceae bacterium]
MIRNKAFGRRFVIYILGFFIMTMGISLSVKSNLGVSPVSSIPYTITCVFGIEMGNATILFHVFLVLRQIILLRKDFKPVNLLQIVVGIVFGKFTTLCNYLANMLPPVDNMGLRIILMLISTILIAVGIFFYLPADIMPLAGEGAMQAVSRITKIEFPKVKIGFDVSMVLISLIVCLIALHGLGSVGIGTVIASFLVGFNLGKLTKKFGAWRDKLLRVS